jgi:predicted small metal-binding protein
MSVESESEEDAVIRLSREARAHMEKAHSDMPRMSDDEIKGIVRSEMKKG